MSVLSVFAFLPALPSREALDAAWQTRGGVDGDWSSSLSCEGVSLTVRNEDDDAEWFAALRKVAGAKARKEARVVVEIAGSSDNLNLAEELVDLAGGALVSEDEELLVKWRRPRAKAAKPKPNVDIDPSIPEEVMNLVGVEPQRYRVYPRRDCPVSSGAIVRKLPEAPERVGYGKWDRLVAMDDVVMRPIRDAKGTYELIELPERGRFPTQGWKRMIHYACAWARLTHGVIRNDRGDSYDFAPEKPLPASIAPPPAPAPDEPLYDSVTKTLRQPGTGRMTVIGHEVRVAWKHAAGEGTSDVLLGGSTCNPVLDEVLNGAKVGAKMRLKVRGVRQMHGVVPPLPDGEEVVLELEILAIVRG